MLDAIRAFGPTCVAVAEADENLRRVFVTTGLDERLQICNAVGVAVAAARSAVAG